MAIKLFNKWDFSDVVVDNLSLKSYLILKPIIVPRTNGYYHKFPMYKKRVNIVERLANKLMANGHKGRDHFITSAHHTGKGSQVAKIIFESFQILEKKTKQNPIQVLVKAIENAAPREEVITLERGGARYPHAVDMSPQRRIDLVLKFLAQGAYHKSFRKSRTIAEVLADEVFDCYQKGNKSLAMSKRNEIEKMAASAK